MPPQTKKPTYLWEYGDPHRLPEKKVEAMVISLYRTVGVWVVKTSQPQKPQGMTIGIPDLRCYWAGVRVGRRVVISWWHEVKRYGKKPTPGQLEFHENAQFYDEEVVVGGVNTAIEWVDIHGIAKLPLLDRHW